MSVERVETLCVSVLIAVTSARGWGQEPSPKPKRIAVMVPVTQPVIEELLGGFKDRLSQLGHTEGSDIEYRLFDAAGDPSSFTAIVQAAIQLKPAILVPVSTPITQRLANENMGGMNCVFLGVTDPIGAGVLGGGTLERPGGWITGVADVFPYEAQVDLIRTLLPAVRKIGLVYNASEENSQFARQQLERYAQGKDIRFVDATVASPGELNAAANTIVRSTGCLYLFPDNTVAGNVSAVLRVAEAARVPVFAGDAGMVKQGAIGTVSLGYRGVGALGAGLVDQVLKGRSPGELSVMVARGDRYYFNLDAAKTFGVAIPRELLDKAAEVYGKVEGARPADRQAGGQPWKMIVGLAAAIFVIVVIGVLVSRRSRQEQ